MKVTVKSERTEESQQEYYVVKWDTIGKVTGKPYRACSSIFTDRNNAERFAATKANPELVVDHCAFFL